MDNRNEMIHSRSKENKHSDDRNESFHSASKEDWFKSSNKGLDAEAQLESSKESSVKSTSQGWHKKPPMLLWNDTVKESSSNCGWKRSSSSISDACSGWNNKPSSKTTGEKDCWSAPQAKKVSIPENREIKKTSNASTQTIQVIAIDMEDRPEKKTNEYQEKWNNMLKYGYINTEYEISEVKNAKNVFTDGNEEEYFKGEIPFDKIVSFGKDG